MRLRPLFFLLALASLFPKATAAEKISAPDWVVLGKIVKRDEIWDRRSNPLMGRPDFMKEIVWKVEIRKVKSGKGLHRGDSIQVSLKDKNLLPYRAIREGSSGRFWLSGTSSPFSLLDFWMDEAGPQPTVLPRPTSTPLPPPPFPEGLWAKELKGNAELRAKVCRWAQENLGLENPEIIYRSSFSGPMPPHGGYLYWGIKGKIRGRRMVWQPGYGKEPREGEDLLDPHENQK